tara:strand:+ start:2888 stop:3028 length:141 start_codon:yes stop_codon:yes gene_type:complete
MPKVTFDFGDSSKTVNLEEIKSVDDLTSNMKEVITEDTKEANDLQK